MSKKNNKSKKLKLELEDSAFVNKDKISKKENETIGINKNPILFFIFFRLLNCYLVRTWFVPDEYWQSQEVAHRLAFGY